MNKAITKVLDQFNTFDQEIESLVELGELKYRIEQKLFQNKTIQFIKKSIILLILTNAFVRQITFNNYKKLKYFNREALIVYFLQKQQFL